MRSDAATFLRVKLTVFRASSSVSKVGPPPTYTAGRKTVCFIKGKEQPRKISEVGWTESPRVRLKLPIEPGTITRATSLQMSGLRWTSVSDQTREAS